MHKCLFKSLLGFSDTRVLSFVRNIHTVFHSTCTGLHSWQQWTGFQFLDSLTNTFIFCLFCLIVAILMRLRWQLTIAWIYVSQWLVDCLDEKILNIFPLCFLAFIILYLREDIFIVVNPVSRYLNFLVIQFSYYITALNGLGPAWLHPVDQLSDCAWRFASVTSSDRH